MLLNNSIIFSKISDIILILIEYDNSNYSVIHVIYYNVLFLSLYLSYALFHNIRYIRYLLFITNASFIFKYFSTNMYCCFYYYELKIMTIYESFFLNFYFDKYIINIQTIELNTNCYLFRIQSKYSHLFNLLFVSNVG